LEPGVVRKGNPANRFFAGRSAFLSGMNHRLQFKFDRAVVLRQIPAVAEWLPLQAIRLMNHPVNSQPSLVTDSGHVLQEMNNEQEHHGSSNRSNLCGASHYRRHA
jgi:hypothetical protein